MIPERGRSGFRRQADHPFRNQAEQIGDPAVADGTLDRLVHNAYRSEMRGIRCVRIEASRKHKYHGGKGTPGGFRVRRINQPSGAGSSVNTARQGRISCSGRRIREPKRGQSPRCRQGEWADLSAFVGTDTLTRHLCLRRRRTKPPGELRTIKNDIVPVRRRT